MSFYPKAEVAATVAKADKAVFAARIIEQMELGNGKACAIGTVLQGSHDVATFEQAWAEVEAEKAALQAVSGKDKAEYAAEVAKVAVYADKAKWVAEAAKVGLIGTVVEEAKEI